jgi:hypothetical protein
VSSPAPSPLFSVADKVRVRGGVRDPENPEQVIGHWCGTIEEVDADADPVGYLVRWDGRTREHMTPAFVHRCNLEKLEVESMWLDGPDLEPDDGANLPIESTPDFAPREPEARLRRIFDVRPEDSIPETGEVPFRLYHAFLASRLVTPFDARWIDDGVEGEIRSRPVRVLELVPPELMDPEEGLLCRVETNDTEGMLPLDQIEYGQDTPQGRLVSDYTFWIDNYAADPPLDPFSNQDGVASGIPGAIPGVPTPGRMLRFFAVVGAIYGMTLGALANALDGVRLAALLGAILFALLLGLIGQRLGGIYAKMGFRRAPLIAALLGMAVGTALGALLGAMAASFVGSIPGSILGVVLANVLVRRGPRGRAKVLAGLAGACAGSVVLAFVVSRELALTGLIVGGVVGAASAVFLLLVVLLVVGWVMNRRGM